MTESIAALLLIVAVPALLRAFSVVPRSHVVIQTAGQSLATIRDKELDDDTKEATLQKNSLALFGHFGILLLSGIAAFGIPLGAIWLLGTSGMLNADEVLIRTLTWPYLLGGGLLACLLMLPQRKKRGDYSSLDRLLHRLAFRTYPSQAATADLEAKMFAKELRSVESTNEVFLTGLPRSGTTLLLKSLANLPEFGTHTYRDMPFVLTPLLWDRISGLFRKEGVSRERAHGDGIKVDFDSPEAFEEVVWMTFWKDHYKKDRITPWKAGTNPEFDEFFQAHVKRILALRGRSRSGDLRYLSKNNANFTRLDQLKRIFPSATVIVPFRNPLQHAMSMLLQHRRFSKIHAEDRFAAEYMRGIGHFEFGSNLRPLDCQAWLAQRTTQNADELGFWLEYWIAAYSSLLEENGETVVWVDYDSLCASPDDALADLAHHLDLSNSSTETLLDHNIRSPRHHNVDEASLSQSIIKHATSLHGQLVDQCVARSPQRQAS